MGDVIQQRTLKNAIGCCGTGLHTGDKVMMTLRPGTWAASLKVRSSEL
ncbi:MAG: UDP-3-O-acyl-N-acetylglucosamine deacetylase [Proteobacteria bacterium]|nr:UDP-3-O-acyl-N-acetylglucosamine deacetylase [Pseudomonadota bacterium]